MQIRPPASRFNVRRALVAALAALIVLPLVAVLLAAPATAQESVAQEGEAAPTEAPPENAAGVPEARVPEVLWVRVDTIIHPVSAELIEDSLQEADDVGAAVLVIELSTPGGLLTSTREIFTAMLGADTPVVVYVSPSGAQAASAGFFILMAADVAAMAPGTNTGAAHPVGGQGEDIEGTMGEKVEQDAAATIRSLADRHGRDAALAESAVVESRSFTAEEALDAGLVEVVAPSLQALLVAIDGRQIEKNDRTLTLATADAPVRELEMSPFRRVLSALAHPNIAYILLSLGFLGLYFELMNPGAILPGVVGAICLILAFFSLSVLPVNYAGVALILLAILLFIAEVKVTSYGLLTVSGVISLALGGLMLFKSPLPALRVSLELIVAVSVFALLVVGSLLVLVVRTHRSQVTTGQEGLLGEVGRAVQAIAPRGKVFVHGEYWHATAAEPVDAGADVEVVAVHGMTLTVRSLAAAGPASEAAPDVGYDKTGDETAGSPS
jgi:membrane-bound serine protease (ClpP class)